MDMPLSAGDIERMIVEVTLGLPPTLKSAEANAFREKLGAEIAAIAARGGMVDVPHDLPE